MRRNTAIAWFVIVATLAVVAAVGLHLLLVSQGMNLMAFVLDGAIIFGIVVTAIGCFNPNAAVFGRVISGERISAPAMALTFDDGPSPDTTPKVLDALAAAGMRATFFVLGKHAQRYPELVARIAREGHQVASHGWGHGILVFSSPKAVGRELAETERVLASAGAARPSLFRAPHGFRSPWLAWTLKRHGYQGVGWSKGVFDTARPGAGVIVERSVAAMRPGAILLLHDADGNGNEDRSQTAEALPEILNQVRARGLRAVTISELDTLQPPPRSSWLRSSIGIGFVAAVIALLAHRIGWGTLSATFSLLAGLNLGLVTAAILANLVSVALKAVVWKACLDSIPARPRARYPHIFSAIFIGFLMNSVLIARAGEIGRVVVLRRRINRETGVSVPVSTLLGTVVVETFVLSVTLVCILFVAALTTSGLPSQVMLGTEILLGVALFFCVAFVAIEWGAKRWDHSARSPGHSPGRLRRIVHTLINDARHGLQLFRHPLRASVAVAAAVVSWLANLAAIWFTVLAFGITNDAFAIAIVVFAVSNLVGVVQFTPGNVGVFQVTIAVALGSAFGLSAANALSFGIGLQAIEVGLGAGLGLVFLAVEGLSIGGVRQEMAQSEQADEEAPAVAPNQLMRGIQPTVPAAKPEEVTSR